jgi:hypothetical protein
MNTPNQRLDDGGLTAAAVIEQFKAIAHTLTPAQLVAVVRIARESIPDLVPPDSDPRLQARIRVARATRPQVVDSMANAMEPWARWQQSADTTPGELRHLRSFEEYRALYEELGSFTKQLLFNLNLRHYEAVRKVRVAFRNGRNLAGTEGLTIQPQLDVLAPSLALGKRKKKSKPPADPAAAAPRK